MKSDQSSVTRADVASQFGYVCPLHPTPVTEAEGRAHQIHRAHHGHTTETGEVRSDFRLC
ncbi:hypothetical protein [Roseibium sp. RKSG952]|uniref:hypothetical protein n=1 Tax=Roseibium sp. RKSG952 TaxID=2529384 RepID=UPI0012BC5D1D|nr:hypothetical protein [Roseibium sp. RKSG952]MTI03403.1 hypothetical protein [Roseibium sp. RKSG952]